VPVNDAACHRFQQLRMRDRVERGRRLMPLSRSRRSGV
jgi:hypothetical protein